MAEAAPFESIRVEQKSGEELQWCLFRFSFHYGFTLRCLAYENLRLVQNSGIILRGVVCDEELQRQDGSYHRFGQWHLARPAERSVAEGMKVVLADVR